MLVLKELISNYSSKIGEFDDICEIGDYLEKRYYDYIAENNMEDTEINKDLYYSYFSIKTIKEEK